MFTFQILKAINILVSSLRIWLGSRLVGWQNNSWKNIECLLFVYLIDYPFIAYYNLEDPSRVFGYINYTHQSIFLSLFTPLVTVQVLIVLYYTYCPSFCRIDLPSYHALELYIFMLHVPTYCHVQLNTWNEVSSLWVHIVNDK